MQTRTLHRREEEGFVSCNAEVPLALPCPTLRNKDVAAPGAPTAVDACQATLPQIEESLSEPGPGA